MLPYPVPPILNPFQQAAEKPDGLLEDHHYRPRQRSGKACIRGLRITVYDVLDYMAAGMSQQEILADFPDLTEANICACLAFAADTERRFEIVSSPL